MPVAAIGHVTYNAAKKYSLECVYPQKPGVAGWAKVCLAKLTDLGVLQGTGDAVPEGHVGREAAA